MLENKIRAAMYNNVLDLLNKGHIEEALSGENVDRLAEVTGRAGRRLAPSSFEAQLYGASILEEINAKLKSRNGAQRAESGAEPWEDTPWRNVQTIIDVVSELASEAAEAANSDSLAKMWKDLNAKQKHRVVCGDAVATYEANVRASYESLPLLARILVTFQWRETKRSFAANEKTLRVMDAEIDELSDKLYFSVLEAWTE